MPNPTLADIVAKLDTLIAKADQPAVRWLDVEGAAVRCSLSSKSIRRMLSAGKLSPRRPVRGKILIDVQELDAVVGGATATLRKGRGRK